MTITSEPKADTTVAKAEADEQHEHECEPAADAGDDPGGQAHHHPKRAQQPDRVAHRQVAVELLEPIEHGYIFFARVSRW